MKLIKLFIKNFRGVESFSIEPNGKNVRIYGHNGAGKTSAEDAFLWLLFGKDSADKKDYDLIPHKSGTAEPDVGQKREPFVEAVLEYFGKTVTLKKIYAEEWPTKGEFKNKYAGSKVHYYVDDLEVKATEYQQIVSELVDDKLFKLITNPLYFSDVLSWQERRETLVKIAGELSVEMPKELASLMEARTFDKFYALAKQSVKEKQKALDGLPYAISEAKRLIREDLPEMPEIEALQARKEKLESELLAAKSDDAGRRAVAQIETEISEAKNRYITALDAENAKIKGWVEKLDAERREKDNARRDAEIMRDRLAGEVASLTETKARKLAEWHEANDRTWTGAEMCHTCGQALPAEQVDEARANFNRQRSEDLERLKGEGIALKNSIEQKQAEVAELSDTVMALEAEFSTLVGRIDKGRSTIKQPDFQSTEEYQKLQEKLAAASGQSTDGSKILELNTALSGVTAQISDALTIQAQRKQNAEQTARVEALKEQEKERNTELQTWEKAVHLCEQHVKRVAKALEQAVNGKFKIARFRLFVTQKNGEEAECCDAVYPNGSTNLSTGERLQVGVDIINTLTEFYGVNAPIWIDNAEGVTLPVEASAQLIRLVVSDEKLRVEIEE